MMNDRSALHSLAGASVLALVLAAPAAAQEFRFTLHHMLSPQSAAHREMLSVWAERVKEASGGRIEIEIYPSMTLGGTPPELISQVRDGVVDIVWTVAGYTPGLHPRSEVMELPGVFNGDARAAGLALFDMFDDLKDDFGGIHVLWLHTHGGHAFHTRDKLIRTPADAAGLRIRTPSRTGAWSIEALGATPVATSVPELPQALQRGTVDAAIIPFEIIPPLQLQEQTRYQIEGAGGMRFGTAMFHVSMNLDRWNALPADIQAIFTEVSGRDWWGEVGDIWEGTEAWGIGIATAAGNEHIVLTEEETQAFLDALAPVVDRWIADVAAQGIDGAALVERARALVAANSR